jgi:hypothetical protein
MSNKNFVLCTCFRCKKKGTDNIGNYVHPTTKWRHSKRRKYNLGLDELIDDGINRYNELNNDVDCDDYDDGDGKYNDDEEVYNR